MISDNHNAYNNYNNYIDEYELTNGYAVVDRNFSIVTANEPMYLFLGMSKHYSIMDAIHQVDIDDFIDVANSLRPEIKKSMCIRMRRIDNSYRWVIVDIEKKVIPNTDSSEYLELHISDVLVIRELNKKLQQQIKAFKNETAENRNLLIMQPEPAIIEDTILKAIDDRGVLGRLNDFKYIIAIKNINKEVKLRAFLEHIRTQISWHCKFIDSSYNIEFSIGIGRYPDNGKDLDLIKKKIQKAINMARSKGGNRYIIYKEFLHGEIEDSDNNYIFMYNSYKFSVLA